MKLDFNAIPEQVIPHFTVNDGIEPLVFLAVVPGPKA